MAERSCVDVGEDNWHDQKNCREISPGELRCGGTRNPIRVDISTTRHLGYRGRIFWIGEYDTGNLFASSFLRKDKIPLTHRRRSKYDASQEIRIGDPESSDISKIEVPKFSSKKRGDNLGPDKWRSVIQRQPCYGAQERKL